MENYCYARRGAVERKAERKAEPSEQPQHTRYQLAVVGGGPAGLAAAITAASEGLSVVCIERERWGGQSAGSPRIENYPGFADGLSGGELAERSVEQARRLGAELVVNRVTHLDYGAYTNGGVGLRLTVGKLIADAVLLACGLTFKRIDAWGCERYQGAGVYYGEVPSDYNADGQRVVVVGAGNGAAQAALKLAEHATSVTMLCRGDGLSEAMSHYLAERVKATPNIEVLTQATLLRVHGHAEPERCAVECREWGTLLLAASAVFVFVGTEPASDWLTVDRNDQGYVRGYGALTRGGSELPLATNQQGVFVAGDLRANSIKRIVAAAADGAAAVPLVMNYLRGRR